jgi:hypothetical protein
MDREQSWGVKGQTLKILREITSIGYTVSVHKIEESLLGHVSLFIELHVVDLSSEPAIQHVVRIAAAGRKTDYKCARALAEVVGIYLEDG